MAVRVTEEVAPLLLLASPPALWWSGLSVTGNTLNTQISQEKVNQGHSSFPRFWWPLATHEWILYVLQGHGTRRLKTVVGMWTCIFALQWWVLFKGGFSSPFPISAVPP